MEKKIQKISIWRVLSYFIIYCFIGYVIETIFAMIYYNVIESRKSFLYGPFCAIYGFGAVVFILSLRYFNKNNYRLFIAGCIIGSIVEYVISFCGEVFFDARWWDYSGKFLNINGRICLLYALFWGILSLLLLKVINPQVDKFIKYVKSKINIRILKVVVIISSILMTFNFIISSLATDLFFLRTEVKFDLDVKNKERVVEKYNEIYGNDKYSKFIYKYWGDNKMILTFPNVTIKLRDGSIVWVKDLYPDIQPYYYKFKD